MRWKYRVKVDVEETASRAKQEGFSFRSLEGQPKRRKDFEEPYPLNQIEIKGGRFGSDVRVIVGPKVTQIYFHIDKIPDTGELEHIVENLAETEKVLNEVAVFAPNETNRFGTDSQVPVLSTGMYETRERLLKQFRDIMNELENLAFAEIAYSIVSIGNGDIVGACMRLGSVSNELVSFMRSLIENAKSDGLSDAGKWEDNLRKIELLEEKGASAKSPDEYRRIIEEYWTLFNEC